MLVHNSVVGWESESFVLFSLFMLPFVPSQILKTLFEIVLFDDCSNQWSLSRPMLSLILINEQVRATPLVLVSLVCH